MVHYICTHKKPDADAWGAAIGLALCLRRAPAARAHAEIAWFSENDKTAQPAVIREAMRLYPGAEQVIGWFDEDEPYGRLVAESEDSMCWVVDCGDPSRISAHQEILQRGFDVSFDHHCNAPVARIEHGNPNAPAASALVARMFASALTPAAATFLFAGLWGDTCGFTVGVDTEEAWDAATLLVRAGAHAEAIASAATTDTMPRVRLRGRLIGSLEHHVLDSDPDLGTQHLNITVLRAEDFTAVGAAKADYAGMPSEMLRAGLDTHLAACLCQDFEDPGLWRIAFRSKPGAVVSAQALARSFGGDGHLMAAGGVVKANTADEAAQTVYNAIMNLTCGVKSC